MTISPYNLLNPVISVWAGVQVDGRITLASPTFRHCSQREAAFLLIVQHDTYNKQ